MSTFTITPTYTKTDIRRTFTNFEADLRMIVSRTGKMTEQYLENVCYDIYLFAEYAMIATVDITLLDESNKPLRAAKFTVNESGNVVSGSRPGSNNDWPIIATSELKVIVTFTKNYTNLSEEDKNTFLKDKGFKSPWGRTDINIKYPHLTKEDAQLYGSNGYELKKDNYK